MSPRAIMRPIEEEPRSEYISFQEYLSSLRTKKRRDLTDEEKEYAEYDYFRTYLIKKGGLSLKKVKY